MMNKNKFSQQTLYNYYNLNMFTYLMATLFNYFKIWDVHICKEESRSDVWKDNHINTFMQGYSKLFYIEWIFLFWSEENQIVGSRWLLISNSLFRKHTANFYKCFRFFVLQRSPSDNKIKFILWGTATIKITQESSSWLSYFDICRIFWISKKR